MSTNNSALANLTATYTDSENEEERGGDQSPESDTSLESQLNQSLPSQSYTPARKSPMLPQPAGSSRQGTSKAALRLVSYNDDAVVSDDENVSPNMDTVNMDISEDENESAKESKAKLKPTDKYSYYGFSLPSEPKGKVPTELMEKIKNLHEKMETTNMDMNKVIQERKEFRNPSIYEKLIQFCDINEFGTNYPPEKYDPLQWGPESYYEELAKAQKVEMVKRQKERKDTDKSDQATAAKKAEEDAKKRKSKWDQPAPTTAVVKTGVAAAALTSNITGTKGTVISAFGSLPKKVNNP